MTVKCPNCEWSAEVPDEKIPAGGGKGTCPKCQTKFEVHKDAKLLIEEPPTLLQPNQRDTRACPLCGEEILSVAKKCKHCQSMIDDETTNKIEKKADEDRALKEKLTQIEQNVAAEKSKYHSVKVQKSKDGIKQADTWFNASGEKHVNPENNSVNNSYKLIMMIVIIIIVIAAGSRFFSNSGQQKHVSSSSYEGTVLSSGPTASASSYGVITTKGTFTIEEYDPSVIKGQEVYFNSEKGELTVGTYTYKAHRGLL